MFTGAGGMTASPWYRYTSHLVQAWEKVDRDVERRTSSFEKTIPRALYIRVFRLRFVLRSS